MDSRSVLIFIDGGYLSKISKHFGRGKHLKLDLLQFSEYLATKIGLHAEHIFYYNAPPFQSNIPTPHELLMKKGYTSFIEKLKNITKISVREGRVQRIGNTYIQKGVDTLLTMDLFQEPLARNIKTIILIAADTDFVPVLNQLRKKDRINVILYYFTDRKRNSLFSMSNHLLTACDSKILLCESDFLTNLIRN